MRIGTTTELGLLLRRRRLELGLTQQDLASRIGVSRQWIVEIEKGKPRAEAALLFRVLGALGLQIVVEPVDLGDPRVVDIDAIVRDARGREP